MRPTLARSLGFAGIPLLLCVGCRTGQPATTPAATPDRATGTVTADDIQRTTGDEQQIEKALAGRVAGVVVSRTPDGSIAVRIRGGSSIYGSNMPLYVLDGVAIEPGPGGALAGISANDIESITVLKDAASLTMYGSRGANGVIVVKTKRTKRPPPS